LNKESNIRRKRKRENTQNKERKKGKERKNKMIYTVINFTIQNRINNSNDTGLRCSLI
jgi:hypothetical protein